MFVLKPPRVLRPVGVVVLTAAVEFMLQVVEVVGEKNGVFLAVRVENVVEQHLNVFVHLIAVEEYQYDARDLETQ